MSVRFGMPPANGLFRGEFGVLNPSEGGARSHRECR